MNPYQYVLDAVKEDDRLLSLCAGIGLELLDINCKEIVAVDIHQPHLDKLKEDYPEVKTVCSDILEYLNKQPDNSFDVISLIDGLEHLPKKAGLSVLEACRRVSRREVLVFTPKGFVKNEPHNAWGIEGGDKYQRHLSGWEPEELEKYGFEILTQGPNHSPHGELIQEMMYRCLVS